MKKNIALALVLTLCLTAVTACSKADNNASPVSTAPSVAASENAASVSSNSDEIIASGLDDLSVVAFAYIKPLYPAVWKYSWNNVQEIKADDLLHTCYRSNLFNLSTDYEGDYSSHTATVSLVEWAIQKRFAVESGYLQTSKYYNSRDNTYRLVGGPDFSDSSIALSAKQEGKQIVIEVGTRSKDKTKLMGLLTVELVYGKQVKYVSYSVYKQNGNIPNGNNSQNHDEIISPDLNDLTLISEQYLEPLEFAVWNYSWKDAAEIKADDLLLSCYQSNYFGLSRDWEGGYTSETAPADIVEWSIQQHFEVNSDYLRLSRFYNAEDNTYRLEFGPDEIYPVALSAKQNGKQIVIEVGLHSDFEDEGEKTTPMGLLTMELIYGRQVKYVSYSAYKQ